MSATARPVLCLVFALGACAWTAPPAVDASEMIPRAPFGAGTPSDLSESPVRYVGPGVNGAPEVERVSGPLGGRGWYLAYPIVGPNASLALVAADEKNDFAALTAPEIGFAR
ncbi:MAG: hypothetical protein AAF684_08990, partial [Pseudomonadota bacterium]